MAVVMNDRHNAHAVDEAVNFWIVDLLAITAGVFFFFISLALVFSVVDGSFSH